MFLLILNAICYITYNRIIFIGCIFDLLHIQLKHVFIGSRIRDLALCPGQEFRFQRQVLYI